jgi:hypothetical protein
LLRRDEIIRLFQAMRKFTKIGLKANSLAPTPPSITIDETTQSVDIDYINSLIQNEM